MKATKEASLLRIFLSSTDKYEHKPLYEIIVFAAKEHNMAGATVLRGVMGYGASSGITNSKFWELTEKIPMVIEIIDSTEKIEKFYEVIKSYFEKVRYGCVITIEKTNIVYQKTGKKKAM
jgi:uncharacterized protein